MKITGLTPSQIYFQYYEPNAGGGFCGASAAFLARTLRSQGFDAFTLDFGLREDDLTHVTTIVALEGRFYLVDATFGAYFAKPGTDIPVDVLSVLDGAPYELRRFDMASRDFIFVKQDKKMMSRLRETGVVKDCKPADGGATYACKRPGFGLEAYLTSFDVQLRRNNFESNADTLIAMLRRGVLGIGDTQDSDAMRAFARGLDARGIELIDLPGGNSPRRLLAN